MNLVDVEVLLDPSAAEELFVMAVRRKLASFVLSGATGRTALVSESNAFPEAFATTRLPTRLTGRANIHFSPIHT